MQTPGRRERSSLGWICVIPEAKEQELQIPHRGVWKQVSAQNLLRNSTERNLNYLSTGHLLCKTQRRKSSGLSMPHAPGHTGFCHRALPHLPVWKWRWGPVSKHKDRWHSSSFGEALLPSFAAGLFCKMNLLKTGNCTVHLGSELLCPPLKGFWEPLSLLLMDTCLNYQPHKILWQHPIFHWYLWCCVGKLPFSPSSFSASFSFSPPPNSMILLHNKIQLL